MQWLKWAGRGLLHVCHYDSAEMETDGISCTDEKINPWTQGDLFRNRDRVRHSLLCLKRGTLLLYIWNE